MTILSAFILLLILWVWWGNEAVTLTERHIPLEGLPESFSGLRVAHVSDLHNAQLGKDNARLLELLRRSEPDLIAVTGDLIDSRHTDLAVAEDFIREAVKIAPVYFTTGNHESRIAAYTQLEKTMLEAGVTVLRDSWTELERAGERLRIIGLEDPAFRRHTAGETEQVLTGLGAGEGFSLVLAHRPELLEAYAAAGADLVLSGHAHGGQVRIPFLGGVIAPNQGFFPQYTEGVHVCADTVLSISRGLGNSLFPFRVNNRPELVLTVLETK